MQLEKLSVKILTTKSLINISKESININGEAIVRRCIGVFNTEKYILQPQALYKLYVDVEIYFNREP